MSQSQACSYSLSGVPLKTSLDEVDHEKVLLLSQKGGEEEGEVPGARWTPGLTLRPHEVARLASGAGEEPRASVSAGHEKMMRREAQHLYDERHLILLVVTRQDGVAEH